MIRHITRTSCVGLLLAAGMVAFGSPASAASLRFWLGDGNYPGVFNGAGTVYNDLKSNPKDCAQADASCNASHQIPGTGGSEPDFSATSATFITGVFTMVATADGANKVWDDKQPTTRDLALAAARIPVRATRSTKLMAPIFSR